MAGRKTTLGVIQFACTDETEANIATTSRQIFAGRMRHNVRPGDSIATGVLIFTKRS